MKSREWTAEIVENKGRGGGYHVLSLLLPKTFPKPAAGAFLMLSVGAEPDVLLRRPMAIYDLYVLRDQTRLEILFNIVGRGTQKLSELKPRTPVSLLAPVGNAFSKPKNNERFAIIAGGIGIAPFLLYGRQLTPAQRKQVHPFFGFRSKDQLKIIKDFEKVKLKPICAVEGPGGEFRGTAVDLLKAHLKNEMPTRILTCGPEKMMDVVRSIASQYQIPVEASLETKMACGMGVCLSCVTPYGSEGKFHLVCQEGPIFEFRDWLLDGGSRQSP